MVFAKSGNSTKKKRTPGTWVICQPKVSPRLGRFPLDPRLCHIHQHQLIPRTGHRHKQVEESSSLKVYSVCATGPRSRLSQDAGPALPSGQPCMKRETRKGQVDSGSLSSRTSHLHPQVSTAKHCEPAPGLRHARDQQHHGRPRAAIVSSEAQGSLFRGLSHNRAVQVKLKCSREADSMHDIFSFFPFHNKYT